MKTWEVMVKADTGRYYEKIRADDVEWRDNGLILFMYDEQIVFATSVYNLIYMKPVG